MPLPSKYYKHWKDLCYQIVYQRNAYEALRQVLDTGKESKEVKSALTENGNSICARLKFLLYARGMIIEEMLSMKGQTEPTLPTFNEFIIKDRFDYYWLDEDKQRKQPHIFADPFSEEMQGRMGTLMANSPFSLN